MTEKKKIEEYPAGIKWTKQRKRVYQILEEAVEPLSAARIYARLEPEEQEQYAVSTIYRILTAFEENKLVEKTTWMGEGTIVYELRREGHTHYAVCLDCHRRIPLEHCPLHMGIGHGGLSGRTGTEAQDVNAEDFQVISHKIELYGYCKECSRNH